MARRGGLLANEQVNEGAELLARVLPAGCRVDEVLEDARAPGRWFIHLGHSDCAERLAVDVPRDDEEAVRIAANAEQWFMGPTLGARVARLNRSLQDQF